MSYKLGLCSVSFRNNSAEEILESMKNAELSFVEWGSDVHVPQNDIKTAEKISALQEKYGVKCSSYGTYFRIGVTPKEELIDYIKIAKILGTNILRLWCGNKNSEEYSQEEKRVLFEECKQLSKISEQNGIILCMECHGGTYTNTKESALELMKEVNSPYFKMYWQPNQFKSVEENTESAKALSFYTVNIHVFNWKGEDKYPLREAVETWKKYLTNFGGEHTLLLEFMPDGRIESLKMEEDALKEIAK